MAGKSNFQPKTTNDKGETHARQPSRIQRYFEFDRNFPPGEGPMAPARGRAPGFRPGAEPVVGFQGLPPLPVPTLFTRGSGSGFLGSNPACRMGETFPGPGLPGSRKEVGGGHSAYIGEGQEPASPEGGGEKLLCHLENLSKILKTCHCEERSYIGVSDEAIQVYG